MKLFTNLQSTTHLVFYHCTVYTAALCYHSPKVASYDTYLSLSTIRHFNNIINVNSKLLFTHSKFLTVFLSCFYEVYC